jgi:hypothetical protein
MRRQLTRERLVELLHYDGKTGELTQELAHAAYLAAKAELHAFNPVPRKELR